MSQPAYIDIARPKAKSLRAELREERRIGKMTSVQILAYLGYRHRLFLTVILLVISNLIWVLSVHYR